MTSERQTRRSEQKNSSCKISRSQEMSGHTEKIVASSAQESCRKWAPSTTVDVEEESISLSNGKVWKSRP